MIGVVTRKTFWDFWDNIVFVFIGNFVLVALLLALTLGLEFLAPLGLAVVIPAALIAVLGLAALTAAFAAVLGLVIRREDLHRDVVWSRIAAVVPGAVFFAATTLGLAAALGWLFVLGRALPTFAGTALVIAVIWIAITWVQVAVFAVIARATSATDLTTAARQAVVLVLDNPAYCAAVALFAVVLIAFLIIIVPGPGAALILLDNALTLRRRKYTHAAPGPVDWRRLLAAEERSLARRTPRSILFPWRS